MACRVAWDSSAHTRQNRVRQSTQSPHSGSGMRRDSSGKEFTQFSSSHPKHSRAAKACLVSGLCLFSLSSGDMMLMQLGSYHGLLAFSMMLTACLNIIHLFSNQISDTLYHKCYI